MALIVEGKMPTCCGFCCECLGGGSGAYYCNRAKRQISEVVPPYDKRMEWCPIKGEISDKHGRLIDVDAFFKRLQKQTMELWGEKSKEYQYFLDVMDMIKNAPTIVEAST